mmetsp:Transcript_6561/g.7863  ORF Transcript_6561/g.7863 Transcript_6561/m.7863 type:complete len:96 (+) Transcript_6561:219-506(+)
MESELKMMSDAFTMADANKDDLLNEEEFKVFLAELMRIGAAKGNYEDPRPETPIKWYALANRINPSKEGVSYEEFTAMSMGMVGKTTELKNRDGL